MDALTALTTRRSIREYQDRSIDKAVLEKILDAARLAATARNEQPWEFVVVTDATMRKCIADITEFGKFIARAAACVAVFCKDTRYYLEDGSAASQNILVAAHALGLGACWVAGDKKDYCPQIASMLGVPAGYKLVSLIALGYAAHPPQPKAKRPLESVVHWEKF